MSTQGGHERQAGSVFDSITRETDPGDVDSQPPRPTHPRLLLYNTDRFLSVPVAGFNLLHPQHSAGHASLVVAGSNPLPRTPQLPYRRYRYAYSTCDDDSSCPCSRLSGSLRGLLVLMLHMVQYSTFQWVRNQRKYRWKDFSIFCRPNNLPKVDRGTVLEKKKKMNLRVHFYWRFLRCSRSNTLVFQS